MSTKRHNYISPQIIQHKKEDDLSYIDHDTLTTLIYTDIRYFANFSSSDVYDSMMLFILIVMFCSVHFNW